MAAVLSPTLRTAQQCTKPEMVSAMVKRALTAGIMADYYWLTPGLAQEYDTLTRNRFGSVFE